MALSSASGSFNVTTATAGNTVAVSGLGFQPKVILFAWNGRTASTNGSGTASLERGFGVAISATDRFAVSSGSITGVGNMQTYSAHHDAACIIAQANAAGDDGATAQGDINGAMDVQSMDADGFTLVIDDPFPRDFRVHYLALGGSTLTGQQTGSFTPAGAAPTTQAVTITGFGTPTCVLFAGVTQNAGAAPADTADSGMFLGAMTGSSGEAVWAGSSNDAASTSQTFSYCRRDECIARFSGTVAALDDRAEFSSFDANGFTINWLERGGTGRVYYLALKGLSVALGDLLTQTDTVTAIQESGFGFKPAAVMFLSHGQAASSADTPQDHDRLSLGFATSTSARSAIGTFDEDNANNAETSSTSRFDAVYANIDASDAVAGLMDLQSMDADGFSAIMDDADPSQAFVWYLAFGPAEVAADPNLHWLPQCHFASGPQSAVIASGFEPPAKP